MIKQEIYPEDLLLEELSNLDPTAVNILSEELLQVISKKFKLGVKDDSPNWIRCLTSSGKYHIHINPVKKLVDYNRYSF